MELFLDHLQFDSDREIIGFCVGGALYLVFSDTYFPAENWYDMAYQDLKTWLPNLISFGMNHTDSCKLTFMDGQYTARIARLPDGRITVSCLDDHSPVISDKEIDFGLFIRSVIGCCRKYDRFLFENNKENAFSWEIKQLKSLITY